MLMTGKMADQDMKTVMTSSTSLSIQVDDIDPDGSVLLQARVERLAIKVAAGPGATVEYDSANPLAVPPPGMGALAGVAGTTYAVKVSEAGSVLSVAAVGEETDAEPEAPLPAGPSGMGALGLSGDSLVREAFAGLLSAYPPHPVKLGDKWELGPDALSGLTGVTELVCRLAERRDGYCRIDLTGDLEIEEAETSQMPGMVTSGEGEATGHVVVDEATGCIPESKMEATMRVKMDAPAPMGKSEFEMKMTATRRLVEAGTLEDEPPAAE
jgi:hypothetical protein